MSKAMNLYAYTDEAALTYANEKMPGYMLIKIGQTQNDTDVRIKEQGGAAEWSPKIKLGEWLNLSKIKGDRDVHIPLKKRGLWLDPKDSKATGTEWFFIPANNLEEANAYIDQVVTDLEGGKIRKKLELRELQQKALDQAIDIKTTKKEGTTVIANLCPRFGKTLWALELFNTLHKKYGNRVMLLPAYWLSVHTSFVNELDQFDGFLDIVHIDAAKASDPEGDMKEALKDGKRVLITVSLHGDIEGWTEKYQWIRGVDNNDIFMFADEGDFGTHTTNQVAKLDVLLGADANADNSNLFKVFASGTNVQRLAKGAGRVDGVLYTAYSQLEKTEDGIVNRKFYMLDVNPIKEDVENLDGKIQPSWTKIWGKPYANKAFIKKFFNSLVGNESLQQGINLSNLTDEDIKCFMLLVSANNKEMDQIKKIAEQQIPNYHIKVLNGDYTTNNEAEWVTTKEINESRRDGKDGVIIIANQMGSRSYSVSEIQATVIAYDKGSVDALTQKVSRCLTPGETFDGETKEYGHIFEMSFDGNRHENIENLLVNEAMQVHKDEGIDFASAMTFVLSTINCFNVRYGTAVEVDEADMFERISDQNVLLGIANVTVDVNGILDMLPRLQDIKIMKSQPKASKLAIDTAINTIREGDEKETKQSDKEQKDLQKLIDQVINELNMSATSVCFLAGGGSFDVETYRECIEMIIQNRKEAAEFQEFFDVEPELVIELLDKGVLNEPMLDIIMRMSALNVSNDDWFSEA